MRQTVTNMIGSLPPQFFAVTVTTVRPLPHQIGSMPCSIYMHLYVCWHFTFAYKSLNNFV